MAEWYSDILWRKDKKKILFEENGCGHKKFVPQAMAEWYRYSDILWCEDKKKLFSGKCDVIIKNL